MFILRIEDTDRTRSTEEYIDSIMEGMKWLDLDWDEGPFRQTDRFDVYRRYAEKLLRKERHIIVIAHPKNSNRADRRLWHRANHRNMTAAAGI